MYDTIGDVNAHDLVRRHLDAIMQAVADNRRAITKNISGAIMATFVKPADAVRGASDMLRRLDAFNRASSPDLVLKIGMHRDRSLAVTLNERVDCFGQKVNVVTRGQGLAADHEMVMSEDAIRKCSLTRGPAGRGGHRDHEGDGRHDCRVPSATGVDDLASARDPFNPGNFSR